MKKLSLLLMTLSLLVGAPLASCGSSETSNRLQFVVTYELNNEEKPILYGVYMSSNKEMNDKNYRIEVSKLKNIRKYISGPDGGTVASNISGSKLEVGDLLTINLKNPTKVSNLKKEKFLDDVSSMTASKTYGASGTVGEGNIEYWGTNIAGRVEFEDIPLFLTPTLEVIEPESIPVGTKGYGGYYKYTSFERFYLSFVINSDQM